MAYGTIKVDTIENTNGQTGNAIGPGFKNRIINGAMVIDQRNAGAAVSNANSYTLDRWILANGSTGQVTFQQDSTAPAGFTNSAKVTVTTSDAVSATEYVIFRQKIEGFNIADLAWGTANAKTVTLSFWVRSSLTGTFGGVLTNGAQDRVYPFTYSINSANTFEYKTVTIAGDTTGTWLTNNGIGIDLSFGLGVGSTYSGTAGSWTNTFALSVTGAVSVIGTLNATWYITGVQLEVGSTATSFDYRPYGTELDLCYRYYFKDKSDAASRLLSVSGQAYATTGGVYTVTFPTTMRTRPTAVEQSGTASDYRVWKASTSSEACTSVPVYNGNTTTFAGVVEVTVAANLVAGDASQLIGWTTSAYLGWSAEL